jgi:DNA-binding NtrC family response regulator
VPLSNRAAPFIDRHFKPLCCWLFSCNAAAKFASYDRFSLRSDWLMPRPRLHELTRLLERTRQIVYALDEDRRIVYFNEAASRWSGYAPDEMLGLQCQYHSSLEASGAAALACSLAPPPDMEATAPQTVSIAGRGRDEQPLHAEVRFVPLPSEKGDGSGMLAIVCDAAQPPRVEPADSQAAHLLHARIQRLRQQFRQRFQINHLLGDAPAIVRARQQAELAAGSLASVLIVGPRGSGREYLARAIHYSQPAGSEPLVPLACPLLGAELLSSTIAALARRLPAVPGGKATLLLNDIDQLAAPLQKGLAEQLHSAQQQVRVIATAQQPLAALAAAGRFDIALAHALSVLSIELPSLAERLDDLPLLAQLFLEECNARQGKQVGRFSEAALDLLAEHPWPGNLDELDEVVRQAHQRAQGGEIAPDDLPPAVHYAADAAAYPRPVEETIVLDDFLAAIERELIERAMARAKGNKTKAAHLLGMTRPKLYRRLVQLGMVEADEAPADAQPTSAAGEAGEVDADAFQVDDDEMFAAE